MTNEFCKYIRRRRTERKETFCKTYAIPAVLWKHSLYGAKKEDKKEKKNEGKNLKNKKI